MTGQSCCPSTTYLVALPPVRNAAASLFEFARIAVGCATDTECRHALSPNVSVIACTAHNQQSGEISRRVPEGFCSDRRTKPIRLSRPHLLDGAVSVAFLTSPIELCRGYAPLLVRPDAFGICTSASSKTCLKPKQSQSPMLVCPAASPQSRFSC